MPSKTHIKNLLRGYSLKRSKPEIMQMIKDIADDYEKRDDEEKETNWFQIVVLFWTLGMDAAHAKRCTDEILGITK